VKRTLAWTSLTLALAVAAAQAGAAKDIVEIRLRGHYFAEPATVQITVAVEPAEHHRALVIEADGDQYFRSSILALAGEKEKRLHSVEFKNLPAGTYTLRAQVRSIDEVLATATQDLVVTGVGGR
jgi:methionine-rich copper-binding protein CopC